jgi:two-component system nitrogen regulation response regulator GlnG
MVEKVKTRISMEASTLEQFLSDRLKRYIKDLTRLERSDLYETVISEVEKALIKLVLEATEGNQVRAAKTLGISRKYLKG